MRSFVLLFLSLILSTNAFAPKAFTKVTPCVNSKLVMGMSTPPADEEPTAPVAVDQKGTFYDDEVPLPKETLSNSMRDRLIREASTGLDPDAKQTNVILYISVAIGILVLLGGQGIFF